MDYRQAAKTIDELVAKNIFEAKEIESHLESKGVQSKSDMVRIMRAAADKNAPFVDFVSRNLLGCASRTDEFFELAACLSGWSGSELEPLRRLYGRDPQTALWLIRKLEAADQDASVPLSWLYAGAGEKEPGRLLGMIGKRLSPAQKTAWMTAVGVLYADQRLPSEAEDFLIRLSRSRTTAVQKCAITAMLGRTESKRIQDRLCRIAKSGSDEAKASLANVHPRRRPDDKFLLKMLGLCSDTKNPILRESISMSLASCAPEHPLECIKIVRRWSEDPAFCPRFDPLLKAIGKGDLGKLRRFMESWIRDAKGSRADAGALPYALSRVYRGDEMRLVELLETAGRDKTTQILILDVLETFLSDWYKRDRRSAQFCKRAETAVLNAAKRLGTDARPDQELEPFMQVLDLIRQTRHPVNANISDARNNLKRFENLGRIMGPGTLEGMVRGGHTLAVWLSHAVPDPEGEGAGDRGRRGTRRQEISRAWASEIDAALRAFGDGKGTARIRRGLASKTEFLDTLSELTVAARLKRKFPTTLQPRVGNNALDVESTVGGSRVLFEVFRPKGDIRLRYVRGAHTLANAILPKVVKKIDGQIKSALGDGVPVVLVIDSTDAREIVDADIDDALFGTEYFAMPFGEGGAAGQPRPARKKDSVYDRTAGAGAISAVLLVEMGCGRGSKIEIGGKLFRAPNPAVPLGDGAAGAIEGALFEAA